jgi:hypothetical protein
MVVAQLCQKLQKFRKRSACVIDGLEAGNVLDEDVLRPIGPHEPVKFAEKIFPPVVLPSAAPLLRKRLARSTCSENHGT